MTDIFIERNVNKYDEGNVEDGPARARVCVSVSVSRMRGRDREREGVVKMEAR